MAVSDGRSIRDYSVRREGEGGGGKVEVGEILCVLQLVVRKKITVVALVGDNALFCVSWCRVGPQVSQKTGMCATDSSQGQ